MATFAIYVEDLADGSFEVHACVEKGIANSSSAAAVAVKVALDAIKCWSESSGDRIQPRTGTVIDLRTKKGQPY